MAIFAHFCQHKIQQMFVATKNTLQISISSWSLSPFRHFSYIFSHWCMPLLTMWWAFTYLIDISWPSKFLWCLDLCVVKAYFFKQKFINYIFCILWFLLICIATEPLDLKVFSCWLHGWTLLQDDVTRCDSYIVGVRGAKLIYLLLQVVRNYKANRWALKAIWSNNAEYWLY